jgi:hypothetical protein
VLSLRSVPGRQEKATSALCAEAHGFSLHAGVRCAADQRRELERLCRYITRPAIANERLKCDDAGAVVLQLKSPWRDGTTLATGSNRAIIAKEIHKPYFPRGGQSFQGSAEFRL